MLPDELRDPLKKITKDSPILGLLLAVLLIAISVFSVKHFNRDTQRDNKLELWELKAEAIQKETIDRMREENKFLKTILTKIPERNGSQDTAIKIINKAYE